MMTLSSCRNIINVVNNQKKASLILSISLILIVLLTTKSIVSSQNEYSSVYSDTVQIAVSVGWNLISLPIIPVDPRTTVLFPHAISYAYAYDGYYSQEDSLRAGIGYWLKFAEPEIFTMIGTSYSALSIDLRPGWNLIGSPNKKIAIDELFSDPCGIIFSQYFKYELNGGYIKADTLEPGKGYWLKANQQGSLFEKKWIKVSDLYDATVTVHPTEPNILYAGTPSDFSTGINGKILKSIDWGATWDTLVWNVDASRIILDQSNPTVGYAKLSCANFCIPGILKTTNEGTSWFRSDSGIYLDWETGVGWIIIDPNNNNTLYAETGGPYGCLQYKTTDGGNFWHELIHYDSLDCAHDTLCHFGNGIAMAINPRNSNTLYALVGIRESVRNLFESTSGGDSWESVYRFYNSTASGQIYFSLNDSNTLYMNGRGFFISSDRGRTWQNSDNGLPALVPLGICLSKNPKVMYCYSHAPGLSSIYQTTDGGSNWQHVISDSSYMVFQALNENEGYLYSTNIDTVYHHPSENDGIYKLKICKSFYPQTTYFNNCGGHYAIYKVY